MSLNKSIIFNFFTRFGTALSNLILAVLISQNLGAESRGDQALFVTTVALIQMLTHWLGSSSLVFLVPRHSTRGLLIISNAWAFITTGISWGIVIAIGLIPEEFNLALWIASLAFALGNNLSHALLGKEKSGQFNSLQVLHPILTMVFFAVWLFGFGADIQSFVWSYTLSQISTLIIALWMSRSLWSEHTPEPFLPLLRIFFRHGVFIQLANMTQFLNYRMLYYFIEHFFGKSFLGIYSNAISLAESVWMVTRSISTMQFARIANSEDDQANRKLSIRYTWISLSVSASMMLVLVLLPDSFFMWLFGKEFSGTHEILLLLTPAILAMSASNIFAHYFAGSGKNGVSFLGSLINLIMLLGFFFALRISFGELSAPLAASISFTATLIFHGLMFRFWKMERLKSGNQQEQN